MGNGLIHKDLIFKSAIFCIFFALLASQSEATPKALRVSGLKNVDGQTLQLPPLWN